VLANRSEAATLNSPRMLQQFRRLATWFCSDNIPAQKPTSKVFHTSSCVRQTSLQFFPKNLEGCRDLRHPSLILKATTMPNLSNRMRGLYNHVSEVSKILFEVHYNTLSKNAIGVIRQWDSYIVTLPADITVLDHLVLEPIATYCIKKNVNWKIRTDVQGGLIRHQIILYI
jgi:hypothetical protein